MHMFYIKWLASTHAYPQGVA